MANEIKSKPAKVSYLSAPLRSDEQLSVSWKNPIGNTSSTGPSRATDIGVVWNVKCWPDKFSKQFKWALSGGSSTSDTLDLGQVLTGVGGDYFHPVGSAYLLSVTCAVHPYNAKGTATDAKTTTSFSAPDAPTLARPVFNTETGELTCQLDPPEDEPTAPYVDMWWQVNTYDTKTKKSTSNNGTDADSTTIGDTTISQGDGVDIANYAVLQSDPSRAVKVVFYAKSRGWRKDSDTVTQTIYVSKPKNPTVKAVSIPSSYSGDRVMVVLALNASESHPVTGCRLQVCKNSPHTAASQFDGTETWEDYELQDDGQCTALSIGVAEVVPDQSTSQVTNTTWVRVKSWNLAENALYAYSTPQRLKKLETQAPSAEGDTCYLDPLTCPDGTSILAHAYWGKNGTADGNTGTEFTWSKDENAWSSTSEPTSFLVTRDLGRYSSIENPIGTWAGHAPLYIRDLEVGERYYVLARRYLEGDETTYGKYSAKRSIQVGVPPTGVTITAPAQIATGKGIPCEFAIDAEDEVADRTRWTIYLDPNRYRLNGSGSAITGKIGKSGTGGTVATVPWAKVKEAMAKSGHPYVDLLMSASFGGASVNSPVLIGGAAGPVATLRVWVIDPPKCKVVTHTVTSQPATFDVKCDDKAQDLMCVVTSKGITGDDAIGQPDQEPGDCIWSGVIEQPDWDVNGDSDSSTYPARVTVTLPAGCDLRDGASYRVVVSATSAVVEDGIRGPNASGSFRVAWSRQAPTPPAATVTTSDVTNADGFRTRSATITLVPPSGSNSGDRYEVYRVTPDGAYLMASNARANSVITDEYAPYGHGERAYRVCCVTPDGDRAWRDMPYTFGGGDIRVDFDGTYVELPYNVTLADAFSKDFESRAHFGQNRPVGYWNESVKRTASLSTDLIKVTDAAVEASLRALAQHAGPCFVRLPNGCAFEADVQVSGLDEDEMGGSVVAVSLNVTETMPSGTYELVIGDN